MNLEKVALFLFIIIWLVIIYIESWIEIMTANLIWELGVAILVFSTGFPCICHHIHILTCVIASLQANNVW